MNSNLSSPVELPLGNGFVALVDAVDVQELRKLPWRAVRCSNKVYARTGSNKSMTYMHRFLLGLGRGQELVVDHINGDGLDNRRANIRAVSVAQNNLNRRRPGAVKHRGVYEQSGKFIARVGETYLGSYSTANEAAFMVNRHLDKVTPGVGERNVIDVPALSALYRKQIVSLESLLQEVTCG